MAREFQVGEWLVEPDLNRISRAGKIIPVEPKVLEVLICLAQHPGEVLSKEQIVKTVWAGVYVSEGILSYSISELRKAFSDDAKNPGIIETIPRKGYRLIAAVSKLAPTLKSQPSIAVLPFSDLSLEKDQGYFCDGIAEEIINDLARVKGLHVAARTSSFSFKGKSEDLCSIGRKLGVDAVLEGGVRKAFNQLRITTQLVNVEDGYPLWSERYDRELKDIFVIQDEIAQKVVATLQVTLSPMEKSAIGRVATRDIEAYDFYIRGRQYFYLSKRKSIECALEMFSRATIKDPGYALAFAGMADCYSYLYMYFDNDRRNLEQARIMSRMALELAPDLAEAHSACGLAVSLSKQYALAENHFQAAVKLNPRQFEALYFYGRTCFVQGKMEEAVRLFEQAESVKPEDLQATSLLSFIRRSLGQKEKAIEAYRRNLAKIERHLELNPDDSRALYLGATALAELGDRDRCYQWARQAIALDPEDPYIVYGIACFHARLGNCEEAVDYFVKSIKAGFAQKEWIINDSDFDSIRSHPRFQAALRELEAAEIPRPEA
jgi:adenylate cyclase